MALRKRAGVWLLMAGTAAGLGQSRPATQPTPGPPDQVPAPPDSYWLRVTSDGVHLRSRADRNSVAVTRVDRDTVLQAAGSEFGWHRVQPPEGVFSYVAAEFIDQLGPDRGVVSVKSGNLRVRAGSVLTDLDPAQSEPQVLLPRGTPVQILGRQDDWFRIVPPAGVYLHVSDEFVERITPQAAAQLRAAAAQRVGRASATQASPPQTRPTVAPDLTGVWGQRLLLVEAAIETEARKPALEQSWAEALAHLRPFAEQREEPTVARLAQAWIRRLEQRIVDQAALRAAREIAEREDRDRVRFDREREQIQRSRQRAVTQPALIARGQLLESFAVGREKDRPRYQLQDPLTGRVVAYVEFAAEANIRAAGFVGQYVGVKGERKFDDALGADLIRASAIEILKREIPATGPARGSP